MEALKPRPLHPTRCEEPAGFPEEALRYPHFRFMGSKHRLLRWIYEVLQPLEFGTALDLFSGSGCVAYLLKAMGKQVTASDFMNFSTTIARALVENDSAQLSPGAVERLLRPNPRSRHFIERTFRGIFFTPADLRFLDLVWSNLPALESRYERDLAIAALLRSCVKRQPRGVFTVAGDPERYKDERRDLRLSLKEHFLEQVEVFNAGVFSNGLPHRTLRRDAFDVDPAGYDLVYMDPPYVPRSDDNCYMKRYHFLEGLSCYWEGLQVLQRSKVKKIAKPYTPFSYRRQAVDAFDRLFSRFAASTIVLSYSSNGYPDLEVLVSLLERSKKSVSVYERDHRYHFGTHQAVRRAVVREFLIVGEG